MLNIEAKEKQVQLKKLEAAKEDLELKIMQREDDIDRMKKHIEINLEHQRKLKEELGG